MKTLTAPTPYGYQEVRQVYQRNMMLAIFLAISIQMMIIGAYKLTEWLKQDDTTGLPPIQIPFELLPLPPSLLNSNTSLGAVVVQKKFSLGIPVPVPSCEIDPKIEFATQPNPPNPNIQNTPGIGDIGAGNMIVIPPDQDEPSPDIFQPFEKDPVPVVAIAPQYPDVPLRAGLEGNVIVKVLLTKEGKVKKAILVKSDGDLFIQSAIDAAMKWVFTPALMNGKPVAVWVSIPFRFRLTGK